MLEDAHRSHGLSEPMVCQALYPDVFNMRQGHLISLVRLSLRLNKADMHCAQ